MAEWATVPLYFVALIGCARRAATPGGDQRPTALAPDPSMFHASSSRFTGWRCRSGG